MTSPDQETCRQSGVPSDAEKVASHGTQHPDVQEPTTTSLSGGRHAERPKVAAASTKRKSSERKDAECQSKASVCLPCVDLISFRGLHNFA